MASCTHSGASSGGAELNENRLLLAVGVTMVLMSLLCAIGGRVTGGPPPPPLTEATTRTPITPAPQPSNLLRPVVPESDERTAAVNEALQALAKAAGHGLVACSVDGVLADDAQLWGASHTDRTGNVFRATVPIPVGTAPIGSSPDDPRYVAVWNEAWAGEIGACAVEKVRLLEHRITLEGAASPESLVTSGTCPELVMDGTTLVARSLAYLPCTAVVRGGGLRGELRILAEEPTNHLVLSLAVDDGSPDPVPELPTATPVSADTLSLAREEMGLSPSAEVLLKLWASKAPSGNPTEPPVPE